MSKYCRHWKTLLDWGSLEDRSYLESKQSLLERVNYLKYSEYTKEGDQRENRLETHHTHFFFVDDGTSCLQTDADKLFRKRFEQFILENLKTPIVVILLQVILIVRPNKQKLFWVDQKYSIPSLPQQANFVLFTLPILAGGSRCISESDWMPKKQNTDNSHSRTRQACLFPEICSRSLNCRTA